MSSTIGRCTVEGCERVAIQDNRCEGHPPPEQVGGVPLWEEAIFAFLTKIQAATEERALTRVEATALVLSWMVTGLAKNVDELAMLAGGTEGHTKENALLIAEVCGAMSKAMKVDIEASANVSNRIIRAMAGSIPRHGGSLPGFKR